MNLNSAIPSESRPHLGLSQIIVIKWFVENDGREVSAKEKLLNIEQHCILRRARVFKHYGLITNLLAAVCYIHVMAIVAK